MKSKAEGWSCERCTLFNTMQDYKCRLCQFPIPTSSVSGSDLFAAATEPPPRSTDVADEVLTMSPVVKKDPDREPAPGEWICTWCTLLNQANVARCGVCEQLKGSGQGIDMATSDAPVPSAPSPSQASAPERRRPHNDSGSAMDSSPISSPISSGGGITESASGKQSPGRGFRGFWRRDIFGHPQPAPAPAPGSTAATAVADDGSGRGRGGRRAGRGGRLGLGVSSFAKAAARMFSKPTVQLEDTRDMRNGGGGGDESIMQNAPGSNAQFEAVPSSIAASSNAILSLKTTSGEDIASSSASSSSGKPLESAGEDSDIGSPSGNGNDRPRLIDRVAPCSPSTQARSSGGMGFIKSFLLGGRRRHAPSSAEEAASAAAVIEEAAAELAAVEAADAVDQAVYESVGGIGSVDDMMEGGVLRRNSPPATSGLLGGSGGSATAAQSSSAMDSLDDALEDSLGDLIRPVVGSRSPSAGAGGGGGTGIGPAGADRDIDSKGIGRVATPIGSRQDQNGFSYGSGASSSIAGGSPGPSPSGGSRRGGRSPKTPPRDRDRDRDRESPSHSTDRSSSRQRGDRTRSSRSSSGARTSPQHSSPSSSHDTSPHRDNGRYDTSPHRDARNHDTSPHRDSRTSSKRQLSPKSASRGRGHAVEAMAEESGGGGDSLSKLMSSKPDSGAKVLTGAMRAAGRQRMRCTNSQRLRLEASVRGIDKFEARRPFGGGELQMRRYQALPLPPAMRHLKGSMGVSQNVPF